MSVGLAWGEKRHCLMSARGSKRTWREVLAISALGQKRTFRVHKEKPREDCPGLCHQSGALPGSVNGEKVAYATLDCVDTLLGFKGEAAPGVIAERDRLLREPIVQILDTEHKG